MSRLLDRTIHLRKDAGVHKPVALAGPAPRVTVGRLLRPLSAAVGGGAVHQHDADAVAPQWRWGRIGD